VPALSCLIKRTSEIEEDVGLAIAERTEFEDRRQGSAKMGQTKHAGPSAVRVSLFLLASSMPLSAGAADDVLEAELRSALALEVNIERGRKAYETCAVCHGPAGEGRPDGTFPRLAGQHHGVIMKQIVDIRARRRENPIMHPYVQRLMDPQEITDVSGFVSALPPPAEIGTGPGTDLDVGERLYARDCQSCHGARAEGDASRFIPSLAGQHYIYLLRQIRAIGAGRRGNAHPAMKALVARYRDAELKALVDYASRVEPITRGEP
jgi:cytochrome c553